MFVAENKIPEYNSKELDLKDYILPINKDSVITEISVNTNVVFFYGDKIIFLFSEKEVLINNDNEFLFKWEHKVKKNKGYKKNISYLIFDEKKKQSKNFLSFGNSKSDVDFIINCNLEAERCHIKEYEFNGVFLEKVNIDKFESDEFVTTKYELTFSYKELNYLNNVITLTSSQIPSHTHNQNKFIYVPYIISDNIKIDTKDSNTNLINGNIMGNVSTIKSRYSSQK